jgi:hypothetical protein
LDIQVAALGTFLLPGILDFNLVVVCAFQVHLGKILSGFSRLSTAFYRKGAIFIPMAESSLMA